MSKEEEIKRIDIKEFREKGYLQEVNRRFLHPLGLALEIILDDATGKETLGGVWDYREDEEGIIYNLKESDNNRIDNFKRKRNYIDSELEIRNKRRIAKLGFDIEEIEPNRQGVPPGTSVPPPPPPPPDRILKEGKEPTKPGFYQ